METIDLKKRKRFCPLLSFGVTSGSIFSPPELIRISCQKKDCLAYQVMIPKGDAMVHEDLRRGPVYVCSLFGDVGPEEGEDD